MEVWIADKYRYNLGYLERERGGSLEQFHDGERANV
jgi:hypothetical protein